MNSTTEWPALAAPIEVVRTEQQWRYASSCAAGYGAARLLVWRAEVGHIAAVTELGIGASVTNSAEHIWTALVREYGEPLVLLEHYLGTDTLDLDGEHLDQVYVHGQRPDWRRIWPVPTENPDHARFRQWMRSLVSAGLVREIAGRPG